MKKHMQLSLYVLLVALVSFLVETIYPDLFFICTSFGFLIIIIFFLRPIKNSEINLASTDNAHLQKMQALGQLSAAIAHDFNNILTAIVGYSNLLLKKHKENTPSYIEANHIKLCATRASNLVRQLLTFSKKSKIAPTNINVGTTIQDLSSLINQLMGSSASVSITCDQKDMIALVDITQFEQVIINLAVNARDAMNQEGVVKIVTSLVNIDTKFDTNQYFTPSDNRQISPGEYIKISISDTGTGIKKEILKNIFEPFFSTKNESGTGLGLSTVSQIITKMDGHIFVETKKNVGTTFHIFLEQKHIPVSQEKSSINQEEQDANNKHNILVVEDEKSVRLFNVMALKGSGYNVEEAQSAETALDLIKQHKKYDLILSDVFLGSKNGVKLVNEIKSYLPDIKVILTSGYNKESIKDINISSFAFLEKPYNLEDLTNTIKDTLEED